MLACDLIHSMAIFTGKECSGLPDGTKRMPDGSEISAGTCRWLAGSLATDVTFLPESAQKKIRNQKIVGGFHEAS